MKKYQCEICGKKHDVFYGFSSPEPDCLNDLSEEEEIKRVEKLREDMLLIDKSFIYIKGSIFIEIKDISEWIYFEVWASIEVNYYLERLKEDEKSVSDKPFYGKLENNLFFYENVKGTKVDVIFPSEGNQVIFEILEENHPMATDQKNGISKEQLIIWMQKMHHPKSIDTNEKKESFQVSFEKIIQKAKTEYLALQKVFIIDVLEEAGVLFQIVSPNISDETKSEKGFIIYLPFDTSGEEAKIELERFKKTNYFDEFELDVFDGMPTYLLTVDDEKRLVNLSAKIIKDVYHVDIERIRFDIFEP